MGAKGLRDPVVNIGRGRLRGVDQRQKGIASIRVLQECLMRAPYEGSYTSAEPLVLLVALDAAVDD